jgi:hypothetical protein
MTEYLRVQLFSQVALATSADLATPVNSAGSRRVSNSGPESGHDSCGCHDGPLARNKTPAWIKPIGVDHKKNSAGHHRTDPSNRALTIMLSLVDRAGISA